jgi:hypothetical protein
MALQAQSVVAPSLEDTSTLGPKSSEELGITVPSKPPQNSTEAPLTSTLNRQHITGNTVLAGEGKYYMHDYLCPYCILLHKEFSTKWCIVVD